jgi:hypothetical protein
MANKKQINPSLIDVPSFEIEIFFDSVQLSP